MKKLPVWESQHYYRVAKSANTDISHPAIQYIKQLAEKATCILEVGCGEGSKLNRIAPAGIKAVGVDISKTAITLAKKQYPQLAFYNADGEHLPFANNDFDCVYTAFVLEHTNNPETVIREMIRVLKPLGTLVLLMPNYGAPHRCSPCYKGNRIVKLVKGLIQDYYCLLYPNTQSLQWLAVEPRSKTGEYHIDWDTTVEPYLGSVINFLKTAKCSICKVSSCWEIKEPQESCVNKIVRQLATLGIYPFIYWGPHAFVVAQKNSI